MGRPKGSKKYTDERKSLNVMVPVGYIEAIERIAASCRPRKSRALVTCELIQWGLLGRMLQEQIVPVIDRALPGDDLERMFTRVMDAELNDLAIKHPEWFEAPNEQGSSVNSEVQPPPDAGSRRAA